MGRIIGIDLGTTNSVVAYMDGNEPRIIVNEEGGRVTPSVVGFSKTGERFVGDVAKRQALINPDCTLHSVKRFIGKRSKEAKDELALVNYKVVEGRNGEVGFDVNGRVYSPPEISAMVLQKLKKSAEDFLGEAVTEAIITVPAHFTDRQRQATKDAGTIAGLEVLRIINEPTAAALAFMHERKKSATIAVYDFGGGTFDISIVRVDRDVGEVRATRGDNSLGGNDIDGVIVDWLLQEFKTEHGMDISGERVARQRLLDAAERAKLELSSALETEIHLPFLMADQSGPKHLSRSLKRARFEQMIQPLLDRTIRECEKALADARLRPEDMDEVILVGGSSRIPRVKEMVRDLFRRTLNQSYNPDEVVAIGAAIQGGVLEGEVRSVTLLDVTSLSIGIEVEGRRFAKLIQRNTVIPTQCTRMLSTVIDNQRSVKIHVLQGEGALAAENVSLGDFELNGIEPGPRGAPRIEVKFFIDASGLLSVSAKDLRSGATSNITINSPTSFSRSELEELRDEASSFEKKQIEQGDLKDLRHQVEKVVMALETMLREKRSTLARNELTELEHAVKRGRMSLTKAADRTNLEEVYSWLRRVHGNLKDKLGSRPTVH
ncbi:MAG TPA: molecular chaperone DnaK [Myxococcota bacterium]|nr:molecular chaperone DnaK [Myxococcota bacterium]